MGKFRTYIYSSVINHLGYIKKYIFIADVIVYATSLFCNID
jgi:hypothetical protein